MGTVAAALQRNPGVRHASANPRSGSVLVEYDHHSQSLDDVFGVLRDVGVVALEGVSIVEGPGAIEAATLVPDVLDSTTDLQRRIERLSHGVLGRRVLATIGVTIVGAFVFRRVGLFAL
jgi:hypothetical protein